MDKTIEVNTSAGPVVVKKLAMQDYAELLRTLKTLPKQLGDFIGGTSKEDLSNNEVLFAKLPEIIADSLPEFCAVLAVASDKDAEFHLKQLDLADNIDVLAAELELNDYKRIVAAVKKIMGPGQVPTSQPAAENPATPQA
jgi:hypothetical protein